MNMCASNATAATIYVNNNNNNNSIQFFILTRWLNSNKRQLQSQHKKIINVQKFAYV
jgi:hypothetical protein